MELTVDNIFSQIKKLKQSDQVSLSQKIASLLKGEKKKSESVKLTDISGLGSHIWTNLNIDDYIEKERQW